MTTAQVHNLEAEFLRRSRAEKAAGDDLAASTWGLAAALLIQAESDSIIASFERSQKRRKLGLRLTR